MVQVVSSQCAGAVDNLAGFYFKAMQAANGSPQPAATQVSWTIFLPSARGQHLFIPTVS